MARVRVREGSHAENLGARDVRQRTPAWRRYVCESFCDTAARVYSQLPEHDEFTLPARAVRRRI